MKRIKMSRLTGIEVYKLILSGKPKIFPMHFWEKPDSLKDAREITRYLIEELLKWSEDDIKNKLTFKILDEYKLGGMFKTLFNNSPYKIINNAYPGKFKPWEMKMSPNKFWNIDTAIEATKWLIEEKLKWTESDIRLKLSQKTFVNNNLCGMLDIIFLASPFKAINTTYPNKFKEWELKMVPQNFWTKEKCIKAIKWLIEEKLNWTIDEVKSKMSKKVFEEYISFSGIGRLYKGSLFLVLQEAYPNENWTKLKGHHNR